MEESGSRRIEERRRWAVKYKSSLVDNQIYATNHAVHDVQCRDHLRLLVRLRIKRQGCLHQGVVLVTVVGDVTSLEMIV